VGWTLVSRKKKVAIRKHVQFASSIRQHSSKFKFMPSLNSHFVRIGDFDCPIKGTHKP
jgi:hypothetical protein